MNVKHELNRIIQFINGCINKDQIVMIPASGGIDLDAIVRPCVKAIGNNRERFFIVLQNSIEKNL